MSIETIVTLIVLAVIALGGIISIIVALIRGEVKKFIVQAMDEAEEKYKDVEDKASKARLKLEYVIRAVNEKYKLMQVFLNVKKFVEYIINISKINQGGGK